MWLTPRIPRTACPTRNLVSKKLFIRYTVLDIDIGTGHWRRDEPPKKFTEAWAPKISFLEA